MDTKRLGLIPSILLMSVFLLSCGDDSIEKKLIGEWKGTKDGETISLILNKDGSWVMIIGDFVIPSSSPDGEESFENLTWEVDNTKNPIHLDLIGYIVRDPNEKVRLFYPLILRFLTQNKIQVGVIFIFEDKPIDTTTSPPTMYMTKRPTVFLSESEDDLILTRQ